MITPQEYSDVRNGANQSVLYEEIRTLACSNLFGSRDKVHPYAFAFSRIVNENEKDRGEIATTCSGGAKSDLKFGG